MKLFLSLVLICAREPYETTREAWVWAEFLGLPDPENAGARRIRTALHELERREFVTLEQREKGKALTVSLLREDGSGRPYTNPADQPPDAEFSFSADDVYFRVPMLLWNRKTIADISTPALVMWLILLAESRGERRGWWFVDDHARSRYGVTSSFRRRGLNELVERKMVTVEEVEQGTSTLYRSSPRKVYTPAHATARGTRSRAQERADEVITDLSPAEREALKQLLLGE